MENGNLDSRLTGISRPLLSVIPTDGGRNKDTRLEKKDSDGLEEGECAGLGVERASDYGEKRINLGDNSKM